MSVMTMMIGLMILSGTGTILALRRCPLARAIRLQVDQVAAAKR